MGPRVYDGDGPIRATPEDCCQAAPFPFETPRYAYILATLIHDLGDTRCCVGEQSLMTCNITVKNRFGPQIDPIDPVNSYT
jgi:hypothetical protein